MVELMLFASYAVTRRCYALRFGVVKALAEQSAAFALMSKLLDANVLDYQGFCPKGNMPLLFVWRVNSPIFEWGMRTLFCDKVAEHGSRPLTRRKTKER